MYVGCDDHASWQPEKTVCNAKAGSPVDVGVGALGVVGLISCEVKAPARWADWKN